MVRIEQVKSGIGQTARMRATLAAIGLHHHQDVVVKKDSPALRGQIMRVRHLLKVTPVKE
jgi:large subunit ribosomal protein L30